MARLLPLSPRPLPPSDSSPSFSNSNSRPTRLSMKYGNQYGKVVGDLMTPSPLVVLESTDQEDAAGARLLLETNYHRLAVADGDGKRDGIIAWGNVVRAALQIKQG